MSLNFANIIPSRTLLIIYDVAQNSARLSCTNNSCNSTLVYLFMFSFDKANNENEDLINIFRVYDREGKGCIDVDELKNVWNNYLKDNIPDESVSIKFESYLCRLPVKS